MIMEQVYLNQPKKAIIIQQSNSNRKEVSVSRQVFIKANELMIGGFLIKSY
jgi:hypothetical protein